MEVAGAQADFFINDAFALHVDELKHGPDARGALGLFVDIGTEGFFKDLRVTCAD